MLEKQTRRSRSVHSGFAYETSMNFAHLASFQAIDSWIDDPFRKHATPFSMELPRTACAFVCEMSVQDINLGKTLFIEHSISVNYVVF